MQRAGLSREDAREILWDVLRPGTAVPGTLVPPPSLKVRGSDCPSDGSVPVITPREAFERLFGKGKKVQAWKNKRNDAEPAHEMMAGMLGWGSAPPPRSDTGGNWSRVWVWAGRPRSACEIPAGIKSAAGTAPASPPEGDAHGPGKAPGRFLGAFRALRWGWRCPEPTRAGSPARKKGKSWELNLSSAPGLSKNQRKICFTQQKNPPWNDIKGFFLKFFFFFLNFFSWIWGETSLGANVSALTAEFP